jgi:putative membrane protein
MKNTTLSLHHFMKAAILLGFAMYIVYLVKTDGILYYIAPKMVGYIKWSSIAFYAMAIYQVYVGVNTLWKKQEPDCGCDHDHQPSPSIVKNAFVYGLFIFPLLLGFLMPDSTMGTSLAAKKGMNLSSSSSIKKETDLVQGSLPSPAPVTPSPSAAQSPAPANNESAAAPATPSASATSAPSASGTANITDSKLDELFPSDKFTEVYATHAKKLYKSNMITVPEESYIETLTTVDLYLDKFIGKKIELDGFIYRQENMSDNQFVVGRFAIQCCSADASPYGLLVEYDRAQVLATDSWIHAVGTIEKTTFNGNEIMKLKLEKFTKIEAPATQYVYPNYEFGY